MQELEVLENQPQTYKILHVRIVRTLATALVKLLVSDKAFLGQEYPAFQLLLHVLQGEISYCD